MRTVGPCLVGAIWDQLRAELGTELVRGNRKAIPTIKHPQWLSATLSGTVMHILLKVCSKKDSSMLGHAPEPLARNGGRAARHSSRVQIGTSACTGHASAFRYSCFSSARLPVTPCLACLTSPLHHCRRCWATKRSVWPRPM